MTGKKTKILDQITAEDAFAILRTLVEEDEGVRKRTEKIAREHLRGVEVDNVASEVYLGLNNIEVEDLWAQSGRTRYGYVDPYERAWEMLEEVLESFMEELRKYQKLGMDKEAKTYLTGILKGIYRFEKESTSEFSEWVVDAPEEYFELILDEWRKGRENQGDIMKIEDFVRENMPDWSLREKNS